MTNSAGVIEMVYGREAVLQAEAQAQMLQGRAHLVDDSHVSPDCFGASSFFFITFAQVVSLELTAAQLPIPISDIVLRTGAVLSKKEAKRLVEGIPLVKPSCDVSPLMHSWRLVLGWSCCRRRSLRSCCCRLQGRTRNTASG